MDPLDDLNEEPAPAVRTARLFSIVGGKAPDTLTEADKLNLRGLAMEMGIELAIAKGKPTRASHIAADIYEFLLTGARPVGPGQKPAEA